MTTLNDIKTPPDSGLSHIDALLADGPQWFYMTPGTNTINYTFSTSAGNEVATAGYQLGFSGAVAGFTNAQQQGARASLGYLSQLTGIQFVETSNGDAAQLHFANANLTASNTTGLCSWNSQTFYDPSNGEVTSYSPDAYVYLDNVEFASQNANLSQGGEGFETLLHELGHALGLKHPHEGAEQLSGNEDSTAFTLMSYEHTGGTRSQFSPYDIAALNFLYGGDGLRGALGMGTGALFLTGTEGVDTLTGSAGNDKLQGSGGNDTINGGAGNDIAIFSGVSTMYTVSTQNGSLTVRGLDGTDTLNSIETLQFSDRSVSAAAVDTTAPATPSLTVTKNGAGYVSGSKPQFIGFAEAGSTVKVFSGATLLGSAVANAQGLWNVVAPSLADGAYSAFATATDAAGNVSTATAAATFLVDTKAPIVPFGGPAGIAGGISAVNQADFAGSAEAGSAIHLVNEVDGVRTVLAKTVTAANGAWNVKTNPLPNGSYLVKLESFDAAGNMAVGPTPSSFGVNSDQNLTGTAGNDTLGNGSAQNNAINGGAGIDSIAYAGARANYTVVKNTADFTISSAAIGTDALVNVERLHFQDVSVALDVNGTAGEAYRMYTAAFNRAPDLEGLGFWIAMRDKGVSLHAIADGFTKTSEFAGLYGANPSNATFVTQLYKNVMHRTPDDAGYVFWLDVLDRNATDRATVLSAFSESPENQAQVIGTIQNGFAFEMYTG